MTEAAAKAASGTQKIRRLALISILVALAVMGLKYIAWWITGSIALFSDALESIVNVIAGIAAYWAIRVSQQPADREHPHGHHKAEYFSAVLEGVLICLAAFLILVEVWDRLHVPVMPEQPWQGLAVNGLATIINAVWATILIRAGKAERSPALEADGHHIMTDVVTSVGVIAGLIGAIWTGLPILDPLLAVVVALNILWQGWSVVFGSLQSLLDKAVEPDDERRIRDIIVLNSNGALEAHDLKTRIAGRATFIEFHLVVDASMSVGAAHAICDRIEAALHAEMASVRVTIHVEPDEERKFPPGTAAIPFA